MRLIDWDKVLEWMHRQKETMEQWSMRIAIENYVDDMPTVDAVPVVRCKDCRWFENDGFHTNCKIMQFCVEAEDYCSKGERKEDAETN